MQAEEKRELMGYSKDGTFLILPVHQLYWVKCNLIHTYEYTHTFVVIYFDSEIFFELLALFAIDLTHYDCWPTIVPESRMFVHLLAFWVDLLEQITALSYFTILVGV